MPQRLVYLLIVALGLGGCYKRAESAASAPPPDYATTTAAPAPVPMDGMDVDADTPEPSPARMVEREEARPGGWRARRAAKKSADEAPQGELAAPAEPAPAGSPGGGTTASSGGDQALEESRKDIGGRLIIYTASMQVSVFNLADAIEKAELLPEKYGGYVQSIQGGTVVLKIPARKLRTCMNELGELGVVEQRTLSADDVSAEYVDIESRIKALEATHKQLLELLSKARTVDEALHVRASLDSVSAELEVLKGRMRQLDNLIAFSTLTLSMYERGPNQPLPSSNDPFPWVDSLGVEATEWK